MRWPQILRLLYNNCVVFTSRQITALNYIHLREIIPGVQQIKALKATLYAEVYTGANSSTAPVCFRAHF